MDELKKIHNGTATAMCLCLVYGGDTSVGLDDTTSLGSSSGLCTWLPCSLSDGTLKDCWTFTENHEGSELILGCFFLSFNQVEQRVAKELCMKWC